LPGCNIGLRSRNGLPRTPSLIRRRFGCNIRLRFRNNFFFYYGINSFSPLEEILRANSALP
jgi:hypothetical protein